jgi:hypothetical protein
MMSGGERPLPLPTPLTRLKCPAFHRLSIVKCHICAKNKRPLILSGYALSGRIITIVFHDCFKVFHKVATTNFMLAATALEWKRQPGAMRRLLEDTGWGAGDTTGGGSPL